MHMPSVSFIEHTFKLFSAQNWKMGVGVYRSGGISSFSGTKELVSARVKAGIGENYEVRMKLHSQGKCVQWMECTCQAYRRRNEKCEHLAAFCMYLDQEKSSLLTRMNMSAGDSDSFLYGNRYGKNPTLADAQEAESSTSHEAQDSSEGEVRPHETPVWIRQRSDVVGLDISEKEPLLLVTVQIKGKSKITYCLGVDDATKALAFPELKGFFSEKLKTIQKGIHSARRFFDVQPHGKSAIRIARCIAFQNADDQTETTFALEKLSSSTVGKSAVFHKDFGYIPFSDKMPQEQHSRWQEYPPVAILDGDTAALLFETKFERMNETAEVRVAKSLEHLSVTGTLEFSELRLKTASDGSITVDTDSINNGNLLAIIKARAEGKKFLATKTGWVKLSDDLNWLKDKIQADGKIKLSTIEFIKFRERFASNSTIVGSGAVVERLRAGLLSTKDLEEPSLEGTQLNLRPYQTDGLKWLWWLYCNGLSGLLADEMGLGKTHQAMGLLHTVAKIEKQKMSLVVCPTSVIDHWIDKLQRFVPTLDVVCYHGSNRRIDALKPAKEHRVIVTSYGIMLRDAELFAQKAWSVVLLDEAHLVKNQTTRTYWSACKIPSRMRLCLTGTPLENDLFELKNLFDYILPNYLGGDTEFKKKYLSTEGIEPLADLELQRIIHPFKMRRRKADVLKDLPEKVEDLRHCHLRKEQHKLYLEALALKGTALIDSLRKGDGPVPYIHVFSVITLLKQICDDPGLVDPRYDDVGSGKLEVLDELLEEAFASDQKVVIFTQYAKMVHRLSDRLRRRNVRHVTLTGSTTRRGDVVREFQENKEVRVFLGSLLAGGAGIDLTAASVVIHFDRWWNAAKENQATDRIHRIGQDRNVQVYKLVTRGTLEERIDDIINRKRAVFDRFVEQDAEVFRHLTREDLLNLLATPSELSTGVDIESEEDSLRNVVEEISL
jgi:SNF2 family DNA or RNA helicase